MKAKKKSTRKPVFRFKFSDGTYTDLDMDKVIKRVEGLKSKMLGVLDSELSRHEKVEAKERAGAQTGIETILERVDSNVRQALNHYQHLRKKHPHWDADMIYDEICKKMKISRRTLSNYWKSAGDKKPRHPRHSRTRR